MQCVTVQVGWFGGAVPLQEVLRVSREPAAPATPAGERSPERLHSMSQEYQMYAWKEMKL